jgi:hypothetical protein
MCAHARKRTYSAIHPQNNQSESVEDNMSHQPRNKKKNTTSSSLLTAPCTMIPKAPEAAALQARPIIRVLPMLVFATAFYFFQVGAIPNWLVPTKLIEDTLQEREDGGIQARTEAKEPLVIHVYGGSVSRGHGTTKAYHEYLQEFLEEVTYNVTVVNFARPATGVGPWVDCGIESQHGRNPDIIISEYHLNEGNHDTLRQWYELSSQNAKHIIVFDIWSWLVPPDDKCGIDPFNACNTYKVVLEEAGKTVTTIKLHDNFSILSMVQRDMYTWQGFVPDFFPKDKIGEECFIANAARQDLDSMMTLKKCRQLYAGAMQHGNLNYHRHLGNALYEHVEDIVLPRLNQTRTDTIALDAVASGQQSTCYGTWGGGIPTTMKKWQDIIVKQNGYTISNPHSSDPTKVTLHTNQTQSLLILDRPTEQNETVASQNISTRVVTVKVGYVGHTDLSDVVSFRLNNQSFTTQTNFAFTNTPVHVRRQLEFMGELPIQILLDEVPPGAHLELTDVVFPAP